jgi:hypothetical protein
MPTLRYSTKVSRLIEDNSTGSLDTINFIKDCSSRCKAKHTACLPNVRITGPPARMIYVQEHCVQLINIQEATLMDYVCLAHRWVPEGSTTEKYTASRRCCTLKTNLSRHEEGISLDDLLPAYREAVAVTRGLGLRYLWIDSLCIVQDDQDDKDNQIANMGNVYLNAYITIHFSLSVHGSRAHT